MNDRIEQLAKEYHFVHEFMSTGECNDALEKYKKFAELIVRECAGIVQPYMSRWEEDCDLVIKIKQHFGVEE